MIKCIIVDDEPHAIELLSGYIQKVPGIDLAFASTNSIEAFQYVQSNKVDLIYLDIHMPEFDGLQFMKLLAGKAKVVLTTAYPQYALEGYEHDIIDYLLKPILFERFFKATQKAMNAITTPITTHDESNREPEAGYMFVKSEVRNKIIKIKLHQVLYIEGMGNYVTFFMKDTKIMTLTTIKELEEKLLCNNFLRIHKSFIIPLDKIDAVEGSQVIIGVYKIPIGDSYRERLFGVIGSKIFNAKK